MKNKFRKADRIALTLWVNQEYAQQLVSLANHYASEHLVAQARVRAVDKNAMDVLGIERDGSIVALTIPFLRKAHSPSEAKKEVSRLFSEIPPHE